MCVYAEDVCVCFKSTMEGILIVFTLLLICVHKARAKKRLVGISKGRAANKDGEYERILRIEKSYMKVASGEAQWQGYFDRYHDNF
jgi:hypothetical protein